MKKKIVAIIGVVFACAAGLLAQTEQPVSELKNYMVAEGVVMDQSWAAIEITRGGKLVHTELHISRSLTVTSVSQAAGGISVTAHYNSQPEKLEAHILPKVRLLEGSPVLISYGTSEGIVGLKRLYKNKQLARTE